MSLGVAAAVYATTFLFTFLMEFDNFDGYGGVHVGDEIALLMIAVCLIGGAVGAALWRTVYVKVSAAVLAATVALVGLGVAAFALDLFVRRYAPGVSVAESTRRWLVAAPLAVALAPPASALVVGGRSRAGGLLIATGLSALGWLGLVVITVLRLRTA